MLPTGAMLTIGAMLMSRISALVLAVCLIAPQASIANDEAKVIGTWKLVSYEVEIQANGQKEAVMGEKPTG